MSYMADLERQQDEDRKIATRVKAVKDNLGKKWSYHHEKFIATLNLAMVDKDKLAVYRDLGIDDASYQRAIARGENMPLLLFISLCDYFDLNALDFMAKPKPTVP